MQSLWHDIPKHHQERTWSIYGKSVPQLFIERAAARADALALRYKDFGLYQEVTWRKYRDDVEAFALGLISLGIEAGDRIAIMGDPCYEYFVADMAGLCVGAITYGIYTTCPPTEVRHELENAGASYSSRKTKNMSQGPELENLTTDLRKMIVGDMRAMFLYRDERILSFEGTQGARKTNCGQSNRRCLSNASLRSSPKMLRSSSTRRERQARRRPR